jgi:hypothetical protein
MSSLVDYSGSVIAWYWQHGRKRRGEYELSTGGWLDSIYEIHDRSLKRSLVPEDVRPCMAIWGPSQSGKSTLLSGFIDRPSGKKRSALQWHDSDPFCFAIGSKDVPSLNPHNFSADASGCVTRFRLAENPPSKNYPVELKFASGDQLLHAIAIGYVTECKPTGDIRYWNEGSLRTLIAGFPKTGPKVKREAYDLLHGAVRVMEAMIGADWPRFQNLKNDWSVLRREILNADGLLCDLQNVESFLGMVFWDGEERLTRFYKDLIESGLRFSRLFPSRILASLEATRILLDIGKAATISHSELDALRFVVDESNVGFIGTGEGEQIAGNSVDFAIFQALVWEIDVPLSKATLEKTAPQVAEILSDLDLLDFPGVAQQQTGNDAPRLDEFEDLELFTVLFKRGKTASIVIGHSRRLEIDAFALLVRMQRPIPQPIQITAGLKSWCQEQGQPWPPEAGGPPLNIVLTFSSKLVHDVCDHLNAGKDLSALDQVFTWFDSIRSVARPEWARFWTTTYPQFDEGCIRREASLVEKAVERILENSAFQSRLGDNLGSLREMASSGRTGKGDGGVLHFLQQVRQGVLLSGLAERRRRMTDEDLNQLEFLMQEVYPTGTIGTSDRRREIEAWKEDIGKSLQTLRAKEPDEDPALRVGSLLRRVCFVQETDIDRLPENMSKGVVRSYLEKIAGDWVTNARNRLAGDRHIVGLNDSASSLRRLRYLEQSVLSTKTLERWIMENLANSNHPQEALRARRFVALKISDLLLRGALDPDEQPRGDDEQYDSAFSQLTAFAGFESDVDEAPRVDGSPHYRSVIAPFFRHLEAVALRDEGLRPDQPGDQEMYEIILSLPSRN